MQYVEALIAEGREDCRISASSRRLGRNPLVNRKHLRDGLQLHFAVHGQPRNSNIVPCLPTSSNAIRFWINKAIRESRYLTSFSNTKFFFDCDEIFDLRSRRIFWAADIISALLYNETLQNSCLPFAKSSSISRSFSFADIDRYSVVIEYRFDCRTDRPPS